MDFLYVPRLSQCRKKNDLCLLLAHPILLSWVLFSFSVEVCHPCSIIHLLILGDLEARFLFLFFFLCKNMLIASFLHRFFFFLNFSTFFFFRATYFLLWWSFRLDGKAIQTLLK